MKITTHNKLASARKMQTERLITWGKTNPQNLFLLDGIGAILSAALLGVVLVKLEEFFGIPKQTLYFLASFPVLFALYDFYHFAQKGAANAIFLKGIAVANIAYCLLSLGVTFYHHSTLTLFGCLYVLGEVMIVIALAMLEYSVAQKLESEKAGLNG